MTSFVRATRLAAAISLLVAIAAPAAARQPIVVGGRIVDGAGQPVPRQPVVLHRVTPDGGTVVAETTSDEAGQFLLNADGPAPEGAVFFAASRYGERLYIGPILRPPLPAPGDYLLEVGVPERALGAVTASPTALPGSAPGTPRRWLLLLLPLAGLAGLTVWAVARRTGPNDERRLLLRIAELDNAWAERPGDRAAYQRERQQLLDRLDATP